MDRIDKAIIRELQKVNCRTSYRSLAKKTGLSPNAVKNRVEKLLKDGVIIRFQVLLVHEAAGFDDFFGLVFTDGTENSKDFVSRMGKNPMIYAAGTLITTEGGAYFLAGSSPGADQQAELGSFLRGFREVRNVELHRTLRPLPPTRGIKIDFSKSQLKVIRCLYENARMKVEEIAKRTGMASKTVRRILRELEPGRGIVYRARVNFTVGELVDAFVRIDWDAKMTSIDEIVHWLQDEYSDDLWWIWVSESKSVMFADFILDSISDIEPISRQIRSAPYVKSTTAMVASESTHFEALGEIQLREMLDEAGV